MNKHIRCNHLLLLLVPGLLLAGPAARAEPVEPACQREIATLDGIKKKITAHNAKKPEPSDSVAVSAYQLEADQFNMEKARAKTALDACVRNTAPTTTASTSPAATASSTAARPKTPAPSPDQVAAARAQLSKDLATAETWRDGDLPLQGPPNGYIIKRDPNGIVTTYIHYDAKGYATKRVDLAARTPMGKLQPQVVQVERHVHPDTGDVFPYESGKNRRPAQPEELPA